MTYSIIRNDEYLQHFGIKGMHWGQRRFQNEDGSVTAAGAQRYYGNSNTFRASNGVTVGAPKNRSVARFRRFQASRVGGAVLNRLADGKHNEQIRRENQAVRESELYRKQMQKQQTSQKKENAGHSKLRTAVGIGMTAAGVAMMAYGAHSYSRALKAQSEFHKQVMNNTIKKMSSTPVSELGKIGANTKKVTNVAKATKVTPNVVTPNVAKATKVTPNVNTFKKSQDFARSVGTPEHQILKTIDDIDDYFMDGVKKHKR